MRYPGLPHERHPHFTPPVPLQMHNNLPWGLTPVDVIEIFGIFQDLPAEFGPRRLLNNADCLRLAMNPSLAKPVDMSGYGVSFYESGLRGTRYDRHGDEMAALHLTPLGAGNLAVTQTFSGKARSLVDVDVPDEELGEGLLTAESRFIGETGRLRHVQTSPQPDDNGIYDYTTHELTELCDGQSTGSFSDYLATESLAAIVRTSRFRIPYEEIDKYVDALED